MFCAFSTRIHFRTYQIQTFLCDISFPFIADYPHLLLVFIYQPYACRCLIAILYLWPESYSWKLCLYIETETRWECHYRKALWYHTNQISCTDQLWYGFRLQIECEKNKVPRVAAYAISRLRCVIQNCVLNDAELFQFNFIISNKA